MITARPVPRIRGNRARPGHSLPELIVAMTFLGSTLVAVGGTAVLGARWTGSAATVQEAVRVAEHVVDSLAALPDPAPGATDVAGLRVGWSVSGHAVRVEVSAPTGPALLVLTGPRLPAVPVLPDVGVRDEAGSAGGAE